MGGLQLDLIVPRRGPTIARMLAAMALAGVLLPAAVRAQEIKIGGTGGALATMHMLADAYRGTHPETKIAVLPSLGSTGGIKAVLAGAIQIAVSARPLAAPETAQGARAVEYARTPFVFAVPLKTSIDAIAVKDLVDIYSGARERWPDGTRIRVVLRPVGDSDSDMVKRISPEVRQAMESAEKRPGMLSAVTDQDAANNIEATPGAFGTTTLAQIVSERRAIKPLRLDGVEPGAKALADGTYRYYKPLFVVTGPKTPVPAQQFISFIRSAAGREILARTGHWVP